MPPLNPVAPAAPGSAEEEAVVATVAIAGSPPPAMAPQAGPAAALPVSPMPPGGPAPASTLISEIRSADAELERHQVPPS
jgi:hypothetical protein